jgi:hypothetical protein
MGFGIENNPTKTVACNFTKQTEVYVALRQPDSDKQSLLEQYGFDRNSRPHYQTGMGANAVQTWKNTNITLVANHADNTITVTEAVPISNELTGGLQQRYGLQAFSSPGSPNYNTTTYDGGQSLEERTDGHMAITHKSFYAPSIPVGILDLCD